MGRFGRLHLPVSESCNIRCRFCNRAFNSIENRPGVTGGILDASEAVATVRRALELCREITVIGIAGPGDALASDSAIKALRAVHGEFPRLIKCVSTNGLMLPERADELAEAGVSALTVTINAVAPDIAERVVSYIDFDGRRMTGREMGETLISRQLDGLSKAARTGVAIKVNAVLIPGINDRHVEDIAIAASRCGAERFNIIPLIPQHEFSHIEPPDCETLQRVRSAAERHIEVFRHCLHCRADACGVPGLSDFSGKLYGNEMETFSHG
jgi:nitrogen fixation protein NifB